MKTAMWSLATVTLLSPPITTGDRFEYSSAAVVLLVDAAPSPSPVHEQQREREQRKRRREQRASSRTERDARRRYYDSNDPDENRGDGKSDSDSDSDIMPDIGTISFQTLFATKRPRDLQDGLISGVSNAVRGAFYGVVTLFGAPFAGLAHRRDLVGFLAGAISGVVLGLAIPLAGLLMSIHQVFWGLVATPAAVRDGFVNCKVWDEEDREWVSYRLDEDAAKLKIEMEEEDVETKRRGRSQQGNDSSRRKHRVKSTEHYDLLGVNPVHATSSEIRSAYRKIARSVHPDKNPDDPEAERKFRELSAAYQTLADPESRQRYDASGVGVNPERPDGSGDGASAAMLDPYVFFAVLFGSDRVEPYVGELGMASTFDALLKLGRAGGEGGSSFSSFAEAKDAFDWTENVLKKRKRQVDIATHLRTRVEDYVDGLLVTEAFSESCRTEALKIAQGESYGATFLLAIGPALVAEADAFLGPRNASVQGLWRGPVNGAKRRLHFFRRRWSMTKAIVRTIKHGVVALYDSSVPVVDDSHSDGEGGRKWTMNSDLLKDNLDNTIPTILEMAWAINFVDISNTLSGACDKLFYDSDVLSWEDRLQRAEAVLILGTAFYSVGMEAMGGNITFMGSAEDIKARATAAFMESLKEGRENSDKYSGSDEM